MSIIPSGAYNIGNLMYSNLYFAMSGNEFVGSDVADTIQVNFQDGNTARATLYDTASQLYIGFNMEEAKVTGYTDPQVLNLIPSGDSYSTLVIQEPNTGGVCYLQGSLEGSPIGVEPQSGNSTENWRFLMV